MCANKRLNKRVSEVSDFQVSGIRIQRGSQRPSHWVMEEEYNSSSFSPLIFSAIFLKLLLGGHKAKKFNPISEKNYGANAFQTSNWSIDALWMIETRRTINHVNPLKTILFLSFFMIFIILQANDFESTRTFWILLVILKVYSIIICTWSLVPGIWTESMVKPKHKCTELFECAVAK
jgi:hypothetical protein